MKYQISLVKQIIELKETKDRESTKRLNHLEKGLVVENMEFEWKWETIRARWNWNSQTKISKWKDRMQR